MSLKGNTTLRFIAALLLLALLAFTAPLPAQPPAQKWVVSWIGSVHGPYPSGNPSAQPDMKLAFPSAEAGARDQSFRMIVKPEIWGKEARLRLSNALGIRPVTFDGIYVGMQFGSSAVVSGTSRSVTFDGKRSVTIAPGAAAWSDPVALAFVRNPASTELWGRKLAVSFHVAGESGPMTWHANALPRRPLGRRAPREGRSVALGSIDRDLARRDQRLQPQRQRHGRSGPGRNEGRRRAHSHAHARRAGDRRDANAGARRHERRPWICGAGREAQGAQRVHPRLGRVRRRG